SSDARVFCAWLSRNEGMGYWRYRLLYDDEMYDELLFKKTNTSMAGYWVAADGAYVCRGRRDPVVTMDIVRDSIVDDTMGKHLYIVSELFEGKKNLISPETIINAMSVFDFKRENYARILERVSIGIEKVLIGMDKIKQIVINMENQLLE